MVDLVKIPFFSKKRVKSVSAAVLVGGSTAALDGGAYVNTTAVQELFNVPADALITDAYVVPEEAGQAALTCSVGFVGGSGTELINAGAVSTTTVVKDAGVKIPTTTGKKVQATFSAGPTQGRFVVIVEYTEYSKACGDLTKA